MDASVPRPRCSIASFASRSPSCVAKALGPGRKVEIPAYEALLENSRLGRRVLVILMMGISTRNYQRILPQMGLNLGLIDFDHVTQVLLFVDRWTVLHH